MSEFDAATAVRALGPGRYAATVDLGYAIGAAPNGGYLLATMLRAALDDSPHAHPVATSAHFLRVPRSGPAEVRVERLKTGRTAAVQRVTLTQRDEPLVEALVSTGTLDGATPPPWSVAPPPFPPIEECVPAAPPTIDGEPINFARRIDLRVDPATAPDRQDRAEPVLRAYFRLREDRDPDALTLALAVDAMPPVVLALGATGWAPTVELTWHMRARPAPGWLALAAHARLVRDGWFDEEVEVWDSAGHLVAQSRQLARAGRG